MAEFHKYLTFATADGVLTPEEERNLHRFGREHGLNAEEMERYIEAELQESGARRKVAEAAPAPVAPTPPPRPRSSRPARGGDPKAEFMRMLQLTNLDKDGMTDETRDAFINMAENLGIDPGEAEDLVDLYLGQSDDDDKPSAPAPTPPAPAAAARTVEHRVEVAPAPAAAPAAEFPPFVNSLGGPMLFIPSGEYHMGSEGRDAGPNERPLSKVTLSRFFISKFPVTNAEYEVFDPTHARKRAPGAGDRHPVVYVSSLEAIKFCSWLSARDRKKYRLPTEAEWEFAARGTDSRRYPWGQHDGRGDLANFADKNTVFAWSDREIDDGFAESSPVGAFPNGASPFGVHDMAGNVWEWCLDFFETYRGTPRVNPRGATSGAKRVYRGGSWKSRFNSLRTTARGSNLPGYSCNDVGFRIVCECE